MPRDQGFEDLSEHGFIAFRILVYERHIIDPCPLRF